MEYLKRDRNPVLYVQLRGDKRITDSLVVLIDEYKQLYTGRSILTFEEVHSSYTVSDGAMYVDQEDTTLMIQEKLDTYGTDWFLVGV